MLPPGVPLLLTGVGLEAGGVTAGPGDELEAVEVEMGASGVGGGEILISLVVSLGVSLDLELRGNLLLVGVALLETCWPISELETDSWPRSIFNN